MARNGSGTYARTHADYVAGTPILKDDINGELNDIASALTQSVSKDGQTTMTGNLPMGGFKATNNASATATTDLPTALQIQRDSVSHGTDNTAGGTPNTIVVACVPVIASYTDGMRIQWTPAFANTGTATFNAGAGALSLKRPDGSELSANDVDDGFPAEARYSSTFGYWILLTYPAVAQSIFTTKGDLAVKGASSIVRLAAPSNGGVYFGASGESTGYKSALLFPSHITGWTYANNVGDATNDIDISAGAAMDATGAYPIVGSQLTKRSDANWTVGNNQGALDTGAVGNSDYYIWAIARSDTGVVDYLFSLSSTAPTMPTNYDYKRLIGWFKRSGGAIVTFLTYEMPGGALQYLWMSPTLDVNLANTLTTTRRTDAVKVPQNISTLALLNVTILDAASAWAARIATPDLTDVAPGDTTTAPLATMRGPAATATAAYIAVQTSSTGLVSARADLATVDQYSVATEGFIWARRV